jgi:TolB-like protein
LNLPLPRWISAAGDAGDDVLAPLQRPLVAVLPFAPAGDDAALRLLGSELADLLRERLARLPVLSAILISSEFLARAPEHALELACRRLRVGHLVWGRCHRHADGASLYVELADTREWNVRWAGYFHGQALQLLAPECATWGALQEQLQVNLLARPLR